MQPSLTRETVLSKEQAQEAVRNLMGKKAVSYNLAKFIESQKPQQGLCLKLKQYEQFLFYAI